MTLTDPADQMPYYGSIDLLLRDLLERLELESMGDVYRDVDQIVDLVRRKESALIGNQDVIDDLKIERDRLRIEIEGLKKIIS